MSVRAQEEAFPPVPDVCVAITRIPATPLPCPTCFPIVPTVLGGEGVSPTHPLDQPGGGGEGAMERETTTPDIFPDCFIVTV